MKFQLILDPDCEEKVVVTARKESQLTDRIRQIVCEEAAVETLAAYREDALFYLPIAQIQCVTVVNGKTYAIAEDGCRYRLRQRLYEIESVLPENFIRINKSSLANERKLLRFAPTYAGGVDAVFQCGYKEYVSRRCFSEIKRRFRTK